MWSKEFEISFYGLKLGNHRFDYAVTEKFFLDQGYEEFRKADFKIELEFLKKSTMLELSFKGEGKAEVLCDLSNEPFEQEIQGNLDLVVKFGEAYNDDNDEVLILPQGEHQMNVGQYLYEMMVLAVPGKKVHPGIEDGSLKSEIIDRLNELSPSNQKNESEIDPRWEGLKKLLIDKNK